MAISGGKKLTNELLFLYLTMFISYIENIEKKKRKKN